MKLSITELCFLVFAAFTVLASLAVVLSRNLFHSALWLAAAFLGIASIYILLSADFVGMSQIIVYVGAISVLMLFAIMLTEDVVGARGTRVRGGWVAVVPVAMAVGALLFRWFAGYSWPRLQDAGEQKTAGVIGQAFIQKYLFAFELTSVILLVALIGAIMLAKEERS